MSYGLRIFAFLAGLFPFLTPYELLIRPGWPEFSIFMIIPIIVSAGAIAVGGLFILAGILGMHQCLRFDAASRTIAYAYKTAITSLREKRYLFADLSSIEITVHDWESRPPTYGLQFTFADGRKVRMADFAARQEAEECLKQVETLVG